MTKSNSTKKTFWLVSTLLAIIFTIGLLFVRYRRKKIAAKPKQPATDLDIGGDPSGIVGLSEEEASARQPEFDLEAVMRSDERRFLRMAIRQNLLTTFNFDLYGIAIVLYLLGSPGGAVGTLLLVVINLVLNVSQIMYTRKKLDQILLSLRPQATVIRDGILRSIEPAQIVEGDCLVISRGDEVLVDGELIGRGQIIIEENIPDQESRQLRRKTGDNVKAEDYCVEGHAVFRAKEAGINRYSKAPGSELQILTGERTPLQRFMELVFRILFGLVILFALILVADSVIQQHQLVSSEYRDAFSIVFGIAPTSLFFILIIQYAMGTFRISEHGSLVYRTQSIEELANAQTLCISKESLVSGLQVKLELVEGHSSQSQISEALIRQVLGAIVNSVPITTNLGRMLVEVFPGESHKPIEIAPFLFNHGWYGVIFDEPGLRGTFVIGVPEVLERNLVTTREEISVEVERALSKVQRGINQWWEVMVRREQDVKKVLDSDVDVSAADESNQVNIVNESELDQDNKPSILQRLSTGFRNLLSPMEDLTAQDKEVEQPSKDIKLLFAYDPEPNNMYDQDGNPHKPGSLIALAYLYIRDAVRPEAKLSIQKLLEAGLDIKILSSDSTQRAANVAQELGLIEGDTSLVSGEALAGLVGYELWNRVHSKTIIGDLTPFQKSAIVKSLRDRGESVLMVGSDISDVPALKEADLRVALKSGSQAALRLTDIVLLEDSLEPLPYLLTAGQRLVSGVLDTFKLYLSQVVSQLLIIISMILFRLDHFPYHPTQAGVISAFTIAIPNIFLSVWAASGRITGEIMRRRLAHFIAPAALTTAVLAWVVYALFLGITQNVDFTQLTVTYALLMAGWMRVLFVQPPTQFWVGGAKLRGDGRVIGLVLGSIVFFLIVLATPLFQDLLRITWLSPLWNYLLVAVAVIVWALTLRAIWRSGWIDSLYDKFIAHR